MTDLEFLISRESRAAFSAGRVESAIERSFFLFKSDARFPFLYLCVRFNALRIAGKAVSHVEYDRNTGWPQQASGLPFGDCIANEEEDLSLIP
jgi:hypothetical protein